LVRVLLFTRKVIATNNGGDLNLHCITFGAPPVYSPHSITSSIADSSSRVLSFVNYGDLVTRADKSYIRTLINVYAHPNPATRLDFSSAELFNVGESVMLYDENEDGEEVRAKAVVVTEKINGLLFGNVRIHPMKQYLHLLGSMKTSLE
jgi:hypothetical protein